MAGQISKPENRCVLSRRRWLQLSLAGACASAVPINRAVTALGADATGKSPGRIYTTTTTKGKDDQKQTRSLIAIDPETGNWTKVFDGCETRPRVSPDGKTVAYEQENALWIRSLAEGAPKEIRKPDGRKHGSPPVWSADGKQVIVSYGIANAADNGWIFTTFRIGCDGSEPTRLAIPDDDCVHDWSCDGQWILTASQRNAEIGWQLYVMRLDGTDVRQVTNGGNPFYARFSPDGQRLLYSDGTTERRRGIWVVDCEGKKRRRIFATGRTLASACWSPDGMQIAVVIDDRNGRQDGLNLSQVVVTEVDGARRVFLPQPEIQLFDMPDWR